MTWFAFGLLAGVVVGYFVMLLFRPAKAKHTIMCEYWVYLLDEKPPPQDALMARMMRDHPYRVNGLPAIGPSEGLLFSDIRLHVGLVLRSKNPHVFRPDLFDAHVDPNAAHLQALAEAKALQKVRYISEEPVKDDRHLQFIPHMALAIADLAGAKVIFDTVSEQLISVDELRETLGRDGNAATAEFHLRIVWTRSGGGGMAETRGLVKVGVPEIATEIADEDQRVLLTAVLEEAAKQAWQLRALPPSLTVEAYQDLFELQVTPTRKGPYKARVFRAQTI